MHCSISSRPRVALAFAIVAFALTPLAAALAQTTGNIEGAVTAVAGGRPLSDVHARAQEASRSRVLAGIHYRFDIEAGEALGAKVGQAAVAWARADAFAP